MPHEFLFPEALYPKNAKKNLWTWSFTWLLVTCCIDISEEIKPNSTQIGYFPKDWQECFLK